jgi:hypothetical protein
MDGPALSAHPTGSFGFASAPTTRTAATYQTIVGIPHERFRAESAAPTVTVVNAPIFVIEEFEAEPSRRTVKPLKSMHGYR